MAFPIVLVQNTSSNTIHAMWDGAIYTLPANSTTAVPEPAARLFVEHYYPFVSFFVDNKDQVVNVEIEQPQPEVEETEYKCPKCGKSFADKSRPKFALEMHLKRCEVEDEGEAGTTESSVR